MTIMKTIMQSLNPIQCEALARGAEIILAKTAPTKIKASFKVLVYCTVKGDALCPSHSNCNHYAIHRINDGSMFGRKMTIKERKNSNYHYANGYVIGEYTCRWLMSFDMWKYTDELAQYLKSKTTLSYEEIFWFLLKGKKRGYGYRVSDFHPYDNPKELSNFNYQYYKECGIPCSKCKYGLPVDTPILGREYDCDRSIKRAPKGWFYTEDTIRVPFEYLTF